VSPSHSLVELRHINQEYGTGAHRFVALQEVNLQLQEGEFVALLGPSGCGKSTLLRIITGLQQPTAGQVLYRGRPVPGVNPHTTIVFQTFALFPWLTVQANVEVALKAHGVAPEQRARRASPEGRTTGGISGAAVWLSGHGFRRACLLPRKRRP